MSHGSAGTVRSEDGDGCVLINDLIARLTGRLPEDLPLVSPRLPTSNNVLKPDQAIKQILPITIRKFWFHIGLLLSLDTG